MIELVLLLSVWTKMKEKKKKRGGEGGDGL
jgi:hypothetical protein